MLRGYYTASYGMLAQQRKTEMLANNMANANTPGYKTDQASLRAFPEMLLQRIEKQSTTLAGNGFTTPTNATVGSLNTGVYLQETLPTFLQGGLKETNVTTDIALMDLQFPINPETGKQGSVFFTIQNANGETRYTRNGNFTLDGDGYLTTASGLYVLDEQGNTIQLADDQFTVSPEGNLTGSNGESSQTRGRLL